MEPFVIALPAVSSDRKFFPQAAHHMETATSIPFSFFPALSPEMLATLSQFSCPQAQDFPRLPFLVEFLCSQSFFLRFLTVVLSSLPGRIAYFYFLSPYPIDISNRMHLAIKTIS